jgi:hypothetical protein
MVLPFRAVPVQLVIAEVDDAGVDDAEVTVVGGGDAEGDHAQGSWALAARVPRSAASDRGAAVPIFVGTGVATGRRR